MRAEHGQRSPKSFSTGIFRHYRIAGKTAFGHPSDALYPNKASGSVGLGLMSQGS